MYSPVNTIIENKRLTSFRFVNSSMNIALTKGQQTTITGDLFSQITAKDADMFLYNMAGGFINISYAINTRFNSTNSLAVNMDAVTDYQKKLLDRILGVTAPTEKKQSIKKEADKPRKVETKKEEETKSALPVDENKGNNDSQGFGNEEPKEAIPADASYAGLFVKSTQEDASATADPGVGESVIIKEAQSKAIATNPAKAKIVDTPISAPSANKTAPKATRNKIK